LTGHTDSVLSVAFSPDGNTLASGGGNGLYLWNADTGTLKNTLTGHTGAVWSVTFSPDGKILASASDDTVLLWDVDTGTLKSTLTGHTDSVLSVAFSPDGNTLASSSSDGTVLLWDIAPAEPPRLAADVNADGTVNIQDLVQVAANFGATGENPADVNGDGQVNIQDLVAVAAAFGETAAAPAVYAAAAENLTTTEVKQWLHAAQQANLTDPDFQRGVEVLKHLLTRLTPKETVLLPNYPNPFNPETWIPYQLAEPAEVTIRIYAVDGSLVRTLSLGHQATGSYQSRTRAAYWDGRNNQGEPVASGVYFYTLTAGDFTSTRKMLIRK
ncbi:T9SS type A sorting domain-containing protein, partial [Candidatus Poribacteria bacterium]|nr:T9SS type A sorting domain-containing protein [Candidatus Poribacteria bacterium]